MYKTKIINWINNFDKNKTKNMLFITGKEGCGKKYFVESSFKEDHSIIFLNYIDFLDKDVIKKILLKNINKNIINQLTEIKKQLLVITEVENISPKKVKKIFKELNMKNKDNILHIPIILIGTGKCTQYLNFFNNEIYHIEYTADTNYNQKKIKETYNINNNIENIISKELYENIILFFTKKLDYNTIKNMILKEKILFPLLIHENFKKYINTDKNKTIEIIMKIIMKTDRLYEYIFINHEWDLYDKYIFVNCYHINNLMNHGNINTFNINYTKILTKKSLEYLYNSYYKYIKYSLKINYNFDDEILYYNNRKIFYTVYKNKKIESKNMFNYSFNKKNIDKILHYTDSYYIIENIKDIKNCSFF